ncbi:ABC transporter ATP-binding protein [uncultured Fretibacterium sp.]|uniref:ABC transporter ATP-binding protein n=1 Tax=uncultured Fretibacterium sp. TaxID=1678694 RepID=UPI002607B582|nr:ABC transporter ATP-binding protein [uncultured Fretibacterium sp.]
MLEFKNVSKTYQGDKPAAEDVTLTFNEGEFIVFIGTSGSGKTTCMRMINRMTEPTSGTILLNGRDIATMDAVRLRRRIGYVIQQIGLMPHMTIYENVTLVPSLLKWDEERRRAAAKRLMKRVGLDESFLERYPAELSGGQQQRVGVIRALAADPEIILMDEPFGALDPITRDSLQQLIKKLQKELGKTVVFVTHDMDEALALADRIVIMDKGRVVQFDAPENILQNPANAFVESLLGEDRLNEARLALRTVDEVMVRDPALVTSEQSIRDALRLMRRHRAETLFVTDPDGVIQGVVDIFDIEKVSVKQARQSGRTGREGERTDLMQDRIETIMKPASFIAQDTLIRDALHWIVHLNYRYLPVVDGENRLVGVVTRASLVEDIYANVWGADEDAIREDTVQTTDEPQEGVPDA